MSGTETKSHYALIYAPHGRDALVAQRLLKEAGIAARISPDFIAFGRALSDEICFVVLTEEAAHSADLREIAAWIEAQPSWSDLPFILLTARGGGLERNPSAWRMSEILGNVTFLERPFHPTTFISIARSALRGRQRQYDARTRIEELHEGEERLKTALLAGRLGAWELDLETWNLQGSATFKAIFGRSDDQPFGYEDLIAGIHPEDRARMHRAVQNSVATGKDYEIEYRTLWPDRSQHWAEIRARIVHDRVGRHPRMVGVSSDITDRKTAEENQRRLNETLEERVTERTSELQRVHETVLAEIRQREKAEEQLRQSQKMETIGQLTGGVAHDFNNLLMAVLGNLDLLRKYIPADPKAERLLEGALQGAKRGAALTQRLLAFARRQDLQIEPVEIPALVRGMSDLLERSVGPGIEMQMDLPDNMAPALVDANQVELALLNLVVNARDAMPDGGSLTISVGEATPTAADDLMPGSYIRLSVIDSGHGMDSETLARAIDPFFSTKELGKGTGLGLSMIHGLAVQLNGALRLSSTPGKGTRADLWLPVATGGFKVRETPPVELPTPEVAASLNILIVDDDFLIAMSTRGMLEDLGHEVQEANSGANALEILKQGEAFDLLITDFSMPGMTGAQLAEAARKLRPDLPILLATGYAELPSGSELNLPRLGKPYVRDQLAAEIAKIFKT